MNIALTLVFGVILGAVAFGFYIMHRVGFITRTVERIVQTRDVTQRIPIGPRWSEFAPLSRLLNRMLEEIDQHVSNIRQISDNIAHDLRTPLTRLRNHLERLRHAPHEELDEEMHKLIAECDAVLATFNALLRITNIESGRRAAVFQPVNLAAVLRDVVELYEPLASEKNVHLSFAYEPATVNGDKDLLFQALANLLDNAIKYTPEGGVVVARLTPEGGGAKITIVDSGPGIPEAHRDLVFRRFYRVESSRTVVGAGLGLSLVKAIVRLHQGKIELSDREPSGLTVTLTLK